MNCKHCGAPMKVEEGQNVFHCQYCGGYDFPNPNQDGVGLLDETSSMACPFCKQALVSATIKEIRIHSCPNCRGNLIDQSKMLPILRQAESPDSTNEVFSSPSDKSELTRIAVCPSCHKRMNTYPYGGPGNIIIQGCEECRLIWLDYGELPRIMRAYLQMYPHSSEEPGAKKKGIAF